MPLPFPIVTTDPDGRVLDGVAVQANFDVLSDGDGSPFVRGAGIGSFVGNGTGLVTITQPHGLSVVPAFVGATALGWGGFLFEQTTPDATNLILQASMGAVFASGTTYYFHWLAIG